MISVKLSRERMAFRTMSETFLRALSFAASSMGVLALEEAACQTPQTQGCREDLQYPVERGQEGRQEEQGEGRA